jgi:hypothetical protein
MYKDVEVLVLIDSFVYWRGEINSTYLAKVLKVSNDSAKRFIKKYKETFPQKLIYDSTAKVFRANLNANIFDKTPSLLNVARFIDQDSFFEQGQLTTDHNHSVTYFVTPPQRNLNPNIVSKIIIACELKQRLDVDYLSLNAQSIDIGRIIQPHSLVYDGIRWHVRAYDEGDSQFKDFNLARFMNEVTVENRLDNQVDKSKDVDWNTDIEVTIQADPRLPEIQKYCIEKEYGMEDGKLRIKCRVAMVNYLIMRLGLNQYHQDAKAQQICLTTKCLADIKKYLW